MHRVLFIKSWKNPSKHFTNKNQVEPEIRLVKLSLVCDFAELYRYLIDDFLIIYSQRISKRDFKMKIESASHGKKGKREYLTESENKALLDGLNRFFESRVEVKRIRKGEHQTRPNCSQSILEGRIRSGYQEFQGHSKCTQFHFDSLS